MKAEMGNAGARLKISEMGCLQMALCCFAESEKELDRVVDEFYSVCTRRKLKVNVGENKVMVF